MHSIKHVFSSVTEKPKEHMHVGWSSMFLFILVCVNNVVRKYKLRSKDGIASEVGTNDRWAFNQLNILPSGYKCTQSILKAAL